MAVTTETAGQQEREMVTFLLAEQEFGVNIMDVQEIVRMPDITQIPKAPAYVDGIANLRGDVLPVINTRKRFSLKTTETTDRTRVVVVDLNGKNIGMVVDAVSEVLRVAEDKIEPPPEVVAGGVDTAFMNGVVKLKNGERLVMALDPNRVCEIESVAQQTQSARTATTRTDEKTKETIDEEHLVTLSLAGEEYGIDIQAVREIIRVPELIKVPRAPEYVIGLISLRNRLVPLIDMRRLFDQTLVVEERNKIARQIEAGKEQVKKWLQQLQTLDTEEDAVQEGEVAFPLTGWDYAFAAELDRVQEVLKKADPLCKSIDATMNEMYKLPMDKRLAVVHTEVTPQVQRVLDFMDMALAVVQNNEEQRVVITDINEMVVGLVVDRVNEVMRIPKDRVDPPPNLTGDEQTRQVKGVAKLDKGKHLIMILDSDHLVDIRDLKELAQTTDQTDQTGENQGDDLTLQQQALEEEQLVTFGLGKEEFGIRIMHIQEINRLKEITKVPRTPDFVSGVTNLRGVVVPVVDLRTRFGMKGKEADDRTRVVIIDLEGKRTGLIVDQVNEVLRILKSAIEPPPEVVTSDKTNEFIDGIGKLDEGKRMLVLLDVARILSADEKKQLARVGDEPVKDSPPKKQAKPAPAKKQARKKMKKANVE